MVQLGAGDAQPPATVGASAPSDRPPAGVPAAAALPAGQQHRIEFAEGPGGGSVNPHQLVAAPSPWMLSAGTVIPASLITGLNSDLPGMVLAQVTENVRDSATGRAILVPQGARLIGKYDSVVAFGQRRALLIWSRIILPDGSSVELDHMPATDASGYSGVTDGVDSHTWQLLKGIGLSTLLGVGTQLSFGGSGSDLVRALRESVQECCARGRPDHLPQSRHPADHHRSSWLAGPRAGQQGPPPRAVEGMMAELRLARLPDRTLVKLTISISPMLNQSLAGYAALYARTYGIEEPVAELIPAMLGAFLESDKAFIRWCREASDRRE